jgi:four helix bundle protein
MKTRSFKDLIVWKKSYKLALEVYKITKEFPNEEKYALAQQIRRSAVSMPSNISEGYGRQHNKEYKQFLAMAYGSLCELETQYLLAVDFEYTKTNPITELLMKEVGAMLYRMINPIR